MKDSSKKKSRKSLDTSELSELTQIDSDVTLPVEPNGQECHTKKRKKHIKEEPTHDESFSVLSSKKKKVKKFEKIEAIEENQSESFLYQINVEEMLKTDDSDSDDDTDKRKKIKLKQEIKRVSPEICLKRKKKKKPPNTTDDVCDIVKREVIGDDAVTIHSDDSEIVAKKSKRKEKNNSTANSVDDSNKTNDEQVLQNVKIEGKRKRRKRQSCQSDPQQNSDSSMNDSQNGVKTSEYALPNGPSRMFLANNCFEVDFKVPMLHEILNRASKPTEKQRSLLTSLELAVKQGKFSKQEDAQVRENWDYFVKVNGLENKPSNFFRLDKKYIPKSSKRNFLFYLARNMPERTPLSVYNRFKILMQTVKTGRFTESEDETIREAIRQQRNRVNVAELAATLQRSYQAIEKRARLLKQPNSMSRKIKWQERNMATFIKYLLKVTRIKEENLTMLQHRTVTAEEWRKLSAKLDGYPPKSLKRVWFELIYPRLFIPVDLIDVRQVKMELIDLYVISFKLSTFTRFTVNRFVAGWFRGTKPIGNN